MVGESETTPLQSEAIVGNVARLRDYGHFALFSVRAAATRMLSGSFDSLDRLSRYDKKRQNVDFYSVQSYRVPLEDFGRMREGPEIHKASKRVRELVDYAPNRQLRLNPDPDSYSFSLGIRSAGVAMPLDDASRAVYTEMLNSIRDIDPVKMVPTIDAEEFRVYAKFDISASSIHLARAAFRDFQSEVYKMSANPSIIAVEHSSLVVQQRYLRKDLDE